MLLAFLYALLRPLIDLLVVRGRSSADRDLELLVLRQELLVLRHPALCGSSGTSVDNSQTARRRRAEASERELRKRDQRIGGVKAEGSASDQADLGVG